jgi:hypothetical protein
MQALGARHFVMLLLAGMPCVALATADAVSELQARFDRETNSVRKAKLMEKLGNAQFEETRRASQANDYQTVGVVMEKYRDNARIAADALKKEHPDAERHTAGYKQLQMNIHKAIRELDEMLILAPSEYRPPLELVRRDLTEIDDDLLNLLFPIRHPLEKKSDQNNGAPPAPPAPPEKSP